MGARQSKKVEQNENHPFNIDIKNGTTKEAATSQGLRPNQLVDHLMEPTETGLQSKEEQDRQRFAFGMPAAPPHGSTQVVRGVPTANLHCKDVQAQTEAKITKPSQNYTCVPPVTNEANTEGPCHVTDQFHNTTATSSHATSTQPTEPLVHSRQTSSEPNIQVNSMVNTSQKHCLKQDSVPNEPVTNKYKVKDKSERGRAKAAKMRLRQKLAKKLKAQPGGGSERSQQTPEKTVPIVPESSQQLCTVLVGKHDGQQQIPQPNKADHGDTSDCIQVQNKSVHPHIPVVKTPTTPSNNEGCTRTADADANVEVMLQGEPNISQPQDDPVAVKPKKSCDNAVNRNLPMIHTRNVIMEENTNVENERQEPDNVTPVTTAHQVCSEGHWPQFTVNPSCSCKARCRHNPGTGLPPNVQKWIDGSTCKFK